MTNKLIGHCHGNVAVKISMKRKKRKGVRVKRVGYTVLSETLDQSDERADV